MRAAVALSILASEFALLPAPTAGLAAPSAGIGAEQVDRIHLAGTTNMRAVANSRVPRSNNVHHLEVDRPRHSTAPAGVSVPRAATGGGDAPASTVAQGGDDGNFQGIGIAEMTAAGTGNYANSNGTLEPPDQAMCVGSGFVLESVNDSVQVYSPAGDKLLAGGVPLSQFFGLQPANSLPSTDFISDPRCYYDHATQRWFVLILDVNEPIPAQFFTDNNYVAVSKTNDPTGDWYIYHFDVTDNGLNGTPAHPGCLNGTNAFPGCLGDQPLLGADANGIYITHNEYAYTEVLLAPPPVYPPFQTLPVLRSGTAQLFALSKAQLVGGTDTTLVRLDTDPIPFPGPANDSPWQSVQPATPAPGDASPLPAGGVEYFLSDVGLPVAHDVHQVVTWAWTNTASLNTPTPNLTLQHTVVETRSPTDTFYAPDFTGISGSAFPAYQKQTTDHPYANSAGGPEAHLNANDDRMNAVTLVNGTLWAGVNTQLPPATVGGAGLEGENRVGIMYFQVQPSFDGPNLAATMVQDGYVQVPSANVLFPSFGARTDGATVATFTLSGIDYFPSVAWARLDGLAPGAGPTVHISRPGATADDGFSAYGLLAEVFTDPVSCNPCVGRWGDYSASEVDEAGCFWGAAEYIPAGDRTNASANWGTGIQHICLPPVTAPVVTPPHIVVTPLPNTAAGGRSPTLQLAVLGAVVALLLAFGAGSLRRRLRGDR